MIRIGFDRRIPYNRPVMSLSVSELVTALNSPDCSQRVTAAQQLCRHGSDARSASIALVRATGDTDERVCESAAAALEDLGPPNATDLADLAQLLLDDKPDVGYWSATLLGRAGPGASSVVSQLAAALARCKHANVQQRCAWALGQIGAEASPASEALSNALSSSDPRLARLANQSLTRIQG